MLGTSTTLLQNIPAVEFTSAAAESMNPKHPTATPLSQTQTGYAWRVDQARINAEKL